MASSSHKTPPREDLEEEGEDWLQLGLGLGFCKKQVVDHGSHTSVSSSSSPLKINQQMIDLQMGLGLGFDNEGVRNVVAPGNYHSLLQQDHSHHCDSRTSWLWLHHGEMPLPDDSHYYSPRRSVPTSGFWFSLHSSTNREGEMLPQIPKAYIRVKDENVTVFVVKKYLVKKLGLSTEAEIDISCMGQKLVHTDQTLKQVRDAVWFPRLALDALNSSSTTSFLNSSESLSINHHFMPLHYGPSCFN